MSYSLNTDMCMYCLSFSSFFNNKRFINVWIVIKLCQICANHMKTAMQNRMKAPALGVDHKMAMAVQIAMARNRPLHVSKATINSMGIKLRPYKMVPTVNKCANQDRPTTRIVKTVPTYHELTSVELALQLWPNTKHHHMA